MISIRHKFIIISSSVALTSLALSPLALAEDPGLPPVTHTLSVKSLAKMKVYEDVAYASQSPSQRLDLYMPKGVKNPPLMIWFHGGGFMVFDENFMKTNESAKFLEAMIANGLAVASINYRLGTEALYPAAGIDAKSAVRFLRAKASKYGFNSKKFAVGGESAGAYLALMTAITGEQPSIFDNASDPNISTSAKVSAAVSLFGNANFATMASQLVEHPCPTPLPVPPADFHPWFGNLTSPEGQAAFASANLYPLLKTNKSLPTFYIYHGAADCFVSSFTSTEINSEVKALRGKSTLTIVPGAIHGDPKIWDKAYKVGPTLKKLFAAAK